MKYEVKFEQWIEGKPLFVSVDAHDNDDAVNRAIDKLRPLFESYGQAIPETGLRKAATAKKIT